MFKSLDVNLFKGLLEEWGASKEELDKIEAWWCWKQLLSEFSNYKENFEKYFYENNFSTGAYFSFVYLESSQEWLEKVIENEGNEYFAFCMCFYHNSPVEWAQKIVEKNKSKSNLYAYQMHEYCGSSKDWYDNFLKNKRIA